MLADVSGHGSAVAEIANNLRLLMRRYINHIRQLTFVTRMNDAFAKLSSAGGFATAVVATFLAPTRMLTFSNAGHPIPLIYTAKDGRWRFLKIEASHESATGGPSDLPLGIFEDGTYAELEVTLEAGDMILFYTDAFIESQAPTGELLGLDAFLNVVSELGSVNPDTLLEQIVERVVALYQGNLTNDDVTLLLFRPTGKDERVPLKKRLAAPFRLARGILQSLLNGGRGIPLPEVSWENLGLTSMKAAPKK